MTQVKNLYLVSPRTLGLSPGPKAGRGNPGKPGGKEGLMPGGGQRGRWTLLGEGVWDDLIVGQRG